MNAEGHVTWGGGEEERRGEEGRRRREKIRSLPKIELEIQS